MARTKHAHRACESGGAPPRRQLATKAARKSLRPEIAKRYNKRTEKKRKKELNRYLKEVRKKRIDLLKTLTEKTIALLQSRSELPKDYVSMTHCASVGCDKNTDYCRNCSIVIREDGAYHKDMPKDDITRQMKIPLHHIIQKIKIVSYALNKKAQAYRETLTDREQGLEDIWTDWKNNEKKRRATEEKANDGVYEMTDAETEHNRAINKTKKKEDRHRNMNPDHYIIDVDKPKDPDDIAESEEQSTEEEKIELEDDSDDEIDDDSSEGEARAKPVGVPAGDLASRVLEAETLSYKDHPWLEQANRLVGQIINGYVHTHAHTRCSIYTHVYIRNNEMDKHVHQ